MPLAADFEYVLRGREADFQAGLDALAKNGENLLGRKLEADGYGVDCSQERGNKLFRRTGRRPET